MNTKFAQANVPGGYYLTDVTHRPEGLDDFTGFFKKTFGTFYVRRVTKSRPLRLPLGQRRLDDLLDACRHAGGVGMQALDEQCAIIDLLDDQGLQL